MLVRPLRSGDPTLTAHPVQPTPRAAKKRVRIIKKVRIAGGIWKFISLDRIGNHYVWDKHPGCYFLEWWEGRKRRRESAGETPSQALEAQRRKRYELIGERVSGTSRVTPVETEPAGTTLDDAIKLFEDHVKTHSPSKPRTLERYREVLGHFDRISGNKKFVEAITRSTIDDYKIARSKETVSSHRRPISPATVNFEVSVLRAFFYYLIRERGISMENPCAHSKLLRAEKERLKRRPPTYTQAEINKILAASNKMNRAIFATLLLTGLRKEELTNLTWRDIDLKRAVVRLTAKEDFVPKDYEEREIPIPPDLVQIFRKVPETSKWVFPSRNRNRLGRNDMLRRLKEAADRTGVKHATVHKFRHTYATRLLENGCDIVTVQHLLGHSDLDTTRKYLSPDEELKRKAVSRLTLAGQAK